MTYKTTMKAVKAAYGNRIEIGYADLQNLLQCISPAAYTSGAYGWNADIYEIDGNTAIVTGYRPSGNIKPDYDIIRTYNDRAKEIQKSTTNYSDMKEKLANLITEFIEAVIPKR